MSAYMVLCLTILLVFGEFMWGLNYNKESLFYKDPVYGNDKGTHFTILFNTFIFMQIFNEINCRKVGPT